ncbi:DNA invertase [Blastopirellula marina]|uniref:DNA invertase n=1 Tax=Blastopirellula marina TaxID=124 RepID=A0A2S8F684_9BACT|nr:MULTISPECIES: recombinase family protein [Pirellulaceae]PQO27667.1 DNA invertase [Blastopirellula marina]RCS48205.1 recombinase family protein [Bremerella cremea]
MKYVAIYVRVSTNKQDTRSQEADLKRWAEAQEEPVKIYRDKFTGKSMERPGWEKLQEALERGEVSKVVVWRLDRLGRTAKGLTALFDDLVRRGVSLISLKDGVDLSTPAGRMLANVLASVAQFETEVRAERVLAGQQAAKAKGKQIGGRQTGARGQKVREHEDTIRTLHAAGKSVSSIARTLNLSRPTIYSVLRTA